MAELLAWPLADGHPAPLRLPLYDVLLDDADAPSALLLGYLRLLGAAQAQVVEFIAGGFGADWGAVGPDGAGGTAG